MANRVENAMRTIDIASIQRQPTSNVNTINVEASVSQNCPCCFRENPLPGASIVYVKLMKNCRTNRRALIIVSFNLFRRSESRSRQHQIQTYLEKRVPILTITIGVISMINETFQLHKRMSPAKEAT